VGGEECGWVGVFVKKFVLHCRVNTKPRYLHAHRVIYLAEIIYKHDFSVLCRYRQCDRMNTSRYRLQGIGVLVVGVCAYEVERSYVWREGGM
jgi:hypothetical protein